MTFCWEILNLTKRFQARIDEAEECIDGLNSKTATTEKLRNRYQVELEDLQVSIININSNERTIWYELFDIVDQHL